MIGLVESDGRFFIHAHLYAPEKPSVIKHYRNVIDALDDQLRERGLTHYYTLADSPETFRYNSLFGFVSNYEVWDDIYEVMVKEL